MLTSAFRILDKMFKMKILSWNLCIQHIKTVSSANLCLLIKQWLEPVSVFRVFFYLWFKWIWESKKREIMIEEIYEKYNWLLWKLYKEWAYIQVIVLLLEAQVSNNYSSYFLKTSN